MSTDEIRRRLDGLIIALSSPDFVYCTRLPFNNGEIAFGPDPMPFKLPHSGWTLHYAAYGSDPRTKFFSFWDPRSGAYDCFVGDTTPTRFRKWVAERLLSSQGDRKSGLRSMRVAFGPNDGFLAWDQHTVRWGGLPEKLEEILQGILTPGDGSTQGRIVHATLGWDGAFYLATTDGAVYFDIPSRPSELYKLSLEWAKQPRQVQVLRRVYLDPMSLINYIVVEPSRDCKAQCPSKNALSFVIDNLYSPEERSLRQQLRAQSQYFVPFQPGLQGTFNRNPWPSSSPPEQPAPRTSFSASPLFAEFPQWSPLDSPRSSPGFDEHVPKSSKSAPKKGVSTGRGTRFDPYRKKSPASGTGHKVHNPATPRTDLEVAYSNWTSHCDKIFAEKGIAFFPQIPVSSCKCKDPQCHRSVAQCQLKACRHEVEAFLKASGQYSVAWLRRERKRWHPDYFGFKCAPKRREHLSKTASELFSVLSELIEELEREEQA